MDYSQKKVTKEDAGSLWRVPIARTRPYQLTIAPTYIYLPMNSKFLSLKGPLDFFSEAEMARLKNFTYFYMPDFVKESVPFKDAARSVRGILTWNLDQQRIEVKNSYPFVPVPPVSFALHDAVMRAIGPLWGPGPVIEPYFVFIFANELCDPFPEIVLHQAREESVVRFERAILYSSWLVFLSLHLGHCNLKYLNQVRLESFQASMKEEFSKISQNYEEEVNELARIASDSIGQESATSVLEARWFNHRDSRIAQKIAQRLNRVERLYMNSDRKVSTIYGTGRLIHV